MSANCMKAKMLSAALFAALVLSAMQSVRADEATYNYWEGGSGNSWTDKNSETGKYKWTTGELPTATETAAFKQGTQTVKIKEGKCLAAKVVFESGSVITFSRLDSGTADAVTAGEFSGEGTLKLLRTGLKAASAGCTVSVAGFEVLYDSSFPSNYSWLDGGTAESEKMVVESAVTGSGNLACNNYVEVNGDVTLTGFLKLSANATVKNLVYDNGGCKIASDSTGGTIEKVTVKCGTLEYSSSTLKSVSAITVGKFVLDGGTVDIGDGSSIEDRGLEIGVLSGGYLRYTVSEIPETGVPDFPTGLTFAADADLSNVFAIVNNTAGDARKVYAITKTGDVYSFAAAVHGDVVKWIGGGSDNKWENGANWQFGEVPSATQTAVFRGNPTVYVRESAYNEETYHQEISAVEIEEGSSLTIKPVNSYYPPMSLYAGRVSGGGKLRLWNVGLAAYGDADTVCDVTVPTVELVREIRYLDSQGNHDYPGARLNGAGTKGLRIFSKIEGDVNLTVQNRVIFAGDNSGVTGFVDMSSGSGYGQPERYFDSVDSLFPNAIGFKSRGRLFFNFTSGTAKLGTVDFGESYGASIVMKHGANVTLEVVGGKINDSHNGDGFEVWTRDEGADDYLRVTAVDPGTGYTKGCAGLTIKKVGEGTLVYGVTKAHNLVVAEGRVEFTGENNNYDDAYVNVTVKAGASIGSSEAFSHENPNWTLGGDVTHRGTFTFDDEESVAKVYVEAGDATETVASAKRTLTLNKDDNNKAFTTVVTANPALNQWLDGDAAEREAKLNTPNSHGINGIQAYMIGYPTFTDDTVPSLAVGVSEDIFSFNFDIGKSSARKVDGLAVNYSLKSSSDMVNWTNVEPATVSGGAVAASAEALSTGGPYVKLCAEVVPTESE